MSDIKILRVKSDNPVETATIQALYSRSKDSLIEAIDRINMDYGKFVEKYYIQYGHKSIGDCGDIILMIENISSKAAMAIQHNRLYNGQEKSTRYVDFKEVGEFNPGKYVDDETSKDIEDIYRELKYLYSYIHEKIVDRYNEKDSNSMKAIDKYALDYARFFLPVGIKTALSWKTSLSNMNSHLNLLSYGFSEIEEIASHIYQYLDSESDVSVYYPNNNKAFKIIADNYFNIRHSNNASFSLSINANVPDFYDTSSLTDIATVEEYRRAVKYIPMDFLDFYTISICDTMPYANFRDFHRHRSFNIVYNLSNSDLFGLGYVHSDVLEKLEVLLDSSAFSVVTSNVEKIVEMRNSLYERLLEKVSKKEALTIMDYTCCFGHPVIFNAKCNLNAMNYIIDLRTNPSTHELLRYQVVKWVNELKKKGYSNLVISPDREYSHDGWYIERANQDIVEKGGK